MEELLNIDFDELQIRISDLLSQKKYAAIRNILNDMNPADIAELLNDFPLNNLPLLFRLLPKELAAETFVEMDSDVQTHLITGFSPSWSGFHFCTICHHVCNLMIIRMNIFFHSFSPNFILNWHKFSAFIH